MLHGISLHFPRNINTYIKKILNLQRESERERERERERIYTLLTEILEAKRASLKAMTWDSAVVGVIIL
jgi:hypothetical protein